MGVSNVILLVLFRLDRASQIGNKKTPSEMVFRDSRQALDIVLSILSVTYCYLHEKGKTVPISCSFLPIICHRHPEGKIDLKLIGCPLTYNPIKQKIALLSLSCVCGNMYGS